MPIGSSLNEFVAVPDEAIISRARKIARNQTNEGVRKFRKMPQFSLKDILITVTVFAVTVGLIGCVMRVREVPVWIGAIVFGCALWITLILTVRHERATTNRKNRGQCP
jgi:hypothetical protein